MITIELDKPRLRAMADRLRAQTLEVPMTHSQALETLSAVLGYRNWDTLANALNAPTPIAEDPFLEMARRYVKAPVELYLPVHACDEFGEAPAFARLQITVEWLAQLLKMRTLCKEQRVESTAIADGPTEWAREEDPIGSFRLRGDTLVVSENYWYFRAHPKHASYDVETLMLDIDGMLEALSRASASEAPDPSPELTWVDDVLVAAGDHIKSEFLALLVEEGALEARYLGV